MNINELKAARVRKGYTQEGLSKILGVSKPTFSKKERGIIPFTINEVSDLKDVLQLTTEEIEKIFFNNKVAFETTCTA